MGTLGVEAHCMLGFSLGIPGKVSRQPVNGCGVSVSYLPSFTQPLIWPTSCKWNILECGLKLKSDKSKK